MLKIGLPTDDNLNWINLDEYISSCRWSNNLSTEQMILTLAYEAPKWYTSSGYHLSYQINRFFQVRAREHNWTSYGTLSIWTFLGVIACIGMLIYLIDLLQRYFSSKGFDPRTCGLWAHHASAAQTRTYDTSSCKFFNLATPLKKIN